MHYTRNVKFSIELELQIEFKNDALNMTSIGTSTRWISNTKAEIRNDKIWRNRGSTISADNDPCANKAQQ